MAEPLTDEQLAEWVLGQMGPFTSREELKRCLLHAIGDAVARTKAEMLAKSPVAVPEPPRGLAEADVKNLKPGLYRLEMVNGRKVLGAIGRTTHGGPWYASVDSCGCYTSWNQVAAVYSLGNWEERLVVPKPERSQGRESQLCLAKRQDGSLPCQMLRGHCGMHQNGGLMWND